MSTVGVGGTTTMAKAKLLDAVVVVIIVIELHPVVVARMVTMVTAGTVTRTTGTPHSVANVLLPVIGTTPVIARAPATVVEPNTKNAMYLIQIGSVDAPVQIRMWAAPVIMSIVGPGGTTTMVKIKLWGAKHADIIVIAPPPAAGAKMGMTVTVDTKIVQTTTLPSALLAVLLSAKAVAPPHPVVKRSLLRAAGP